jgi:hypothetical protein
LQNSSIFILLLFKENTVRVYPNVNIKMCDCVYATTFFDPVTKKNVRAAAALKFNPPPTTTKTENVWYRYVELGGITNNNLL